MKKHKVPCFAAIVILMLAGCAGRDAKLSSQALEKIAAGNYEQAEADLQRALSINPNNPYALLNLGVVYHNTERPEKAREMYEKVVALKPKQRAVTSNQEGMAGQSLVDIAKRNLELLEIQKIEKRKQAETSAEAARKAEQELAAKERAVSPLPEPAPAPPLEPLPPESKSRPAPLRPEVQPGPPPVVPERAGQYRTNEGDSLIRVAGLREIYADPLMWPSLLRLNPEVLKFAWESEALPYRELPRGTELRFITREEAEAERINLGNRFWAVNVASFEQDRLMGAPVISLVRSGYRPYITEARVKGVEYKRLRVGFFKDRSEAGAAANEIQRTLKLAARPWIQEVSREEFNKHAGY